MKKRIGKMFLKKRIAAGTAALLLCAAFAVPAGAQTVTVSDQLAAVAASESTVQAQAVKVKTNLVGKKELLSYVPYYDGTSVTVIAKADLTGNGKRNKIKIKAVSDSYGTYINKVTIKIGGKKALSLNLKNGYSAGALKVGYIRQSKKKEFIYIYASGDDDVTELSKVYKYNKKTGKLKCVLNLENSATKDKWGNSSYITSADKKYVNAYYTVQPYQTGYIYWKYKYVYKNGKFKLVSNKAKVYSGLGDWDAAGSYQSLFAQNKFITKKKLKLYKAPGSKTRSATIAADKTVTLQKVCCKNGKIYVKFKYGSKSGWTKIGFGNFEKNYDTWFYGLVYGG